MSQDIEIPMRAKQKSDPEDMSELFDSVDDMKLKQKRLTISVDQDLHRKFRIHCFTHGTEMATVIRNFIAEFVNQPLSED